MQRAISVGKRFGTQRGCERINSVALPALTDWVTEINQFTADDRSSTFKLARLLHTAKAALLYGQWSSLWREKRIHFGKRKGECLVFIWEKLSDMIDAQHAAQLAQLPPRWNTLYYLAQLDRSTLERLIREGKIDPRLARKAAKDFVAQFKGTGRKRSKVNVRQRIRRFGDSLLEISQDLPSDERASACADLLKLADQLALQKAKVWQAPESDFQQTPAAMTFSATGELSTLATDSFSESCASAHAVTNG